MLNLDFLQKAVIQFQEVQHDHFLIPIPQHVLIIIIVIALFQLFVGKSTYRIAAKMLLLILGFFYVTNHSLPLAYGFESAINAFYVPIPKINESLIAGLLYILGVILSIASYKDIKSLQNQFHKMHEK